MDTLQIATLIIWITLLPYPILMAVFYNYREIHPIKGRFPRFAILEAINVWLFGTDQFIYILFKVDCTPYLWILFFVSCIIQFAFNYRLVQLLFNYEITQNISELKDNNNIKDWKANWFTTHRWLAQDKFIARIAIVLTGIYIIILIIFEATPTTICGGGGWGRMFSVKGAIGAGFSIIICIKMWKYPSDAFGLKHEFKFKVGTPLSIMTFVYIISVTNSALGFVTDIGLIATCHPILYFTLVPPLHKARKWLKGNLRARALDEVNTLENWLTRPEGVKYFLNYLKTEFSSENLLFYIDVVNFKTLPRTNLAAIKDKVLQIFNKFLDAESPGQVNISFEISEYTSSQVQQILNASNEDIEKLTDEELYSIFDRAQVEVYRLMASDSFTRFQQTSEFERVKKSVSRRPLEKDSKSELDQLLGSPKALQVAISGLRDEDLDNSASSPLSPGSPGSSIRGSPQGWTPSVGPTEPTPPANLSVVEIVEN